MNKVLFSTLLPLALLLSACGGGSSDSGAASASIDQHAIPTSPIDAPLAEKQHMFTQGTPIYSFSSATSQLNNRFTHTLLNNQISITNTHTKASNFNNFISAGDAYVLTKNGVYMQKGVSETPLDESAPEDYFISDDGAFLITSFYNTQGVNPTVRKSLAYKAYDVSGLKVSQFINQNFLSNTKNPTSAANLNASTAVFPQGSVVYVPGLTKYLDEHYQILISNAVSYASFDQARDIDQYPLTRTFGGLTIRYASGSSLMYVQYNGKVYQAWYYAANSMVNFNPKNNYYYNKTAADIVAKELVDSCGTEKYHSSDSGCIF